MLSIPLVLANTYHIPLDTIPPSFLILSEWMNEWITRMVQLPATAAIEYVTACCITRTRTITKTKTRTKIRTRTKTRTKTKTGTKTKIGTITKIVLGPYVRSPQVQYVYGPSGLSVPSVVAWRTNRKTNKQTDKLGLLAPRGVDPLPKFSGYVEVDAHYIFHPNTIWVRPMCTELGPKTPPKCRFCHEANEYMLP